MSWWNEMKSFNFNIIRFEQNTSRGYSMLYLLRERAHILLFCHRKQQLFRFSIDINDFSVILCMGSHFQIAICLLFSHSSLLLPRRLSMNCLCYIWYMCCCAVVVVLVVVFIYTFFSVTCSETIIELDALRPVDRQFVWIFRLIYVYCL